ncbi:MAG TPA: nitrate- and nitrite sensing domain-containing protein [Pseudonocardia sp.]|nr:nitrate- and nitrite sensing domain-containing protein [Pseudonocardia sp.]
MTSIEPGSGWTERLNPRNWTLTWKLVVVGLVPALLALTLGVLRIADDADQAAELSRSSRLVEIRDQVAGAANALRQERDESTLYVAGNRTGDRGVLDIGYGQADGEIEEMVNALRGTGELDQATQSALQRVEDGLGGLVALRSDVTENPTVPSDQVVRRYSDLIGPLDVLDRALLRQLRTPGTAGLADAIGAVTGAVEQLSIEHTVLGAAIRANRQLPGDAALLNVAAAQLLADYRTYQAAVTPDQLGRFGAFLDDPANVQRNQLRAAILSAPEGQIAVPATEWDAAYSGSRGAADRTAEQIRTELVSVSSAAESRASNLAGINSVILMLGLLIGITIAVLVARNLVRSLRVLRTSALDVAERRLPQTVESVRAGDTPDITVAPVPLSGRDEVTQVARAFDAVHMQAIRLAADQATLQAGISAMFVNLSRRSQALVERQLQLIEHLEANEQDADQLSNLFQLDHLATRMRRNSENLLVLAGTDVAKRNVAAVPMVDVLRAAVSEVEQYQRIVVQTPPTATILGRAASDIVHLLAELLDNATNFSPPDSQVVMSSTRTADGAIVVEIADRGVGMTDEELVAANSRLSGPASVDVSTSRRMGLIVVGRLATRHGVDVRLSSSAAGASGSGLTASVTVPTTLVPTSEPRRTSTILGAGAPRPVGAPVPGAPSPRNGLAPRSAAQVSALLAGADGPAQNPPAGTEQPAANGSVNGLPTRQPGSSLRSTGAGPFDRPTTERPPTPAPPPTDREPTDREQTDREPTAGSSAVDREVDFGPRADHPAAPVDSTPGRASRDGADTSDPRTPSTGTPTGVPSAIPASRPAPAPRPGPFGPAPAGRPADQPVDVQRDGTAPAAAGPTNGHEAAEDDRDPAGPRTDPTPVVERPEPGLPQRRPSPQRRPDGPLPFPRDDDVPGGPQRRVATSAPGGSSLFSAPEATRPESTRPESRPEPTPAESTPPVPSPPVPAAPEPARSGPASLDPGPGIRPGPRFDPNETTPIFEEIASAWFRSNRSVPVRYGPDQDEPPAVPVRRPASTPAPAPLPAPEPAPPARPAPAEPPVRDRVGADHGFASLADEGWRAARGVTSTRGDELTAAGLPKRRPRARLVPGSAGSAVLASLATPARSAESIRGRLSSYQQGVRMGRESRQRPDTVSTPLPEGDTDQANAHGTHDEESS